MRPMNMKNATPKILLVALVVAVTLVLMPAAFAAAPPSCGIFFAMSRE